MSTIQDIEQAIELLPSIEREVLESRLLVRRFGLNALDDAERAELISSLEEAERDIQEGRTHTAEELRRAVSEWAGG